MGRVSKLCDQEVDRLLAGKPPSDDGELEELAAFLHDLRGSFEQNPAEEMAVRHLVAIVETAQRLAGSEEATATTGLAGSRPNRVRSPRVSFRRKLLKRNPLTSVSLKLAAATGLVLLLAAFGGVAYAGALPGPIHGTVADLAGNVGLSLPGDDENDVDKGPVNDRDDGPANDRDDGPVNNVDDADVDDRDEGAQQDRDDGAVDDVDDGAVNDRDEGPVNDRDDGPVDDVDEGPVGNVDDGAVNDRDDGAVDNADDASVDNVVEGAVDDRDEGAVGDGDEGTVNDGNQSDRDEGAQGDGEK